MNPSTQEIELALTDVRRAYRLLHDYQRTVLDTAKYVGTQLGFTYDGGYPNFSSCAPRDGRGHLGCSSWDWLNLVFYDFHFTRKTADGKVLNLSIWHFGDTGYFVSDNPAADKTDVSTFAPAVSSGTKIAMLIYSEWLYGDFRYNKDQIKQFLISGCTLPAGMIAGGVIGKCVDFLRLAREVSTDEVIDEFVRQVQGQGISLERIRKSV